MLPQNTNSNFSQGFKPITIRFLLTKQNTWNKNTNTNYNWLKIRKLLEFVLL